MKVILLGSNALTRKCGPNDVRLRIAYCGICGTDVAEYTSGPIFPPAPGVTHPTTGSCLPITLGHEFVGTITELGSNVQNLKIGQAVAVNPACDHRHYGLELCNPCKQGHYNICDETATYGMAAPGGGLCDESVVHSTSCIPIPPNVSMKAAALLEPLAVAHHCITGSGFRPGHAVLICGAGPIGLAILCLLRVLGASRIIVTEVLEPRIKQAKDLGADVVINPMAAGTGLGNEEKDPTLAAILELTGDGVDVAFDASGLQSTFDLAISAVKPRGMLFNVAIHKKPLQIHLNTLTTKEKRLTGGICYVAEDFEVVMRMLTDGSLNVEKLVTSVVPLSRAIQDGFDELVSNPATHVKILVQPGQGL